MTDAELQALNAFKEANLEPDAGLAAIVRVVLNRMADLFQSDGTVMGTVTHGNGAAFSWVGFDMVDGHYTRVASGPQQIADRLTCCLSSAMAYTHAWGRAQAIANEVVAGTYSGPDYDHLTDAVVMYLNPAISSAVWATPDKFVCAIGHHRFYHA